MEAWREELYHHGIKGMKWGVRRTPEQLGHKTSNNAKKQVYSDRYRKFDKGAFGKRGQRRIEKAIQQGKSGKVARGKEVARLWLRYIAKTALYTDILTGGEVHKVIGKAFMDSYMKRKAAESIIKIADHSIDVIDVTDYRVLH